MTRDELLNQLLQMNPSLGFAGMEEKRDAALLLLGAIVDGPRACNATAGIPAEKAAVYIERLRAAGVFVGDYITSPWYAPGGEVDGMAAMVFWLDVGVALGMTTDMPGSDWIN